MEPAKTIIKRLGGPTVVAREIGLSRVTVSRWQAEKEKGGTNGNIPYAHIQKLYSLAAKKGVELDPADFMPTANTAA